MANNSNILLITDDEQVADSIPAKLSLLRQNDKITVCNTSEYKKHIENSLYWTIILHEIQNNNDATLRIINNIKEIKKDTEIILLVNDLNPEFILKAYDSGIFDYLTADADDYELLIKTINCFKVRTLKTITKRNEKFLYRLGVLDEKTNLYKYNRLKENFVDISDDLRIQNGVLAIVTLDENVKTKISVNRLAITIKNNLRGEDIIASARAGKFYLILANIDLDGTKSVIAKIQDKMGKDFKIYAGLCKIGICSFETIEKNALDSLTSAIQNDEMTASLSDNRTNTDTWLNDDNPAQQKDFKLFKIAFTNKMKNVITPTFYRFEKECAAKLINTFVSQYTNNIESVFSLKNEKLHSELVLRFNGYAKFKIEINHSGLNSAENTKMEIPLSHLTDKELNKLLNRLRTEFKQYAFENEE